MRKRLLFLYLLILLPFLAGCIMYCFSIYNIVSSLLFFVGGYVFIKNIFDYRYVRKNRNIVGGKENVLKKDNKYFGYRSYDSIPILKRTRIHHRVRKRIKNIDW